MDSNLELDNIAWEPMLSFQAASLTDGTTVVILNVLCADGEKFNLTFRKPETIRQAIAVLTFAQKVLNTALDQGFEAAVTLHDADGEASAPDDISALFNEED